MSLKLQTTQFNLCFLFMYISYTNPEQLMWDQKHRKQHRTESTGTQSLVLLIQSSSQTDRDILKLVWAFCSCCSAWKLLSKLPSPNSMKLCCNSQTKLSQLIYRGLYCCKHLPLALKTLPFSHCLPSNIFTEHSHTPHTIFLRLNSSSSSNLPLQNKLSVASSSWQACFSVSAASVQQDDLRESPLLKGEVKVLRGFFFVVVDPGFCGFFLVGFFVGCLFETNILPLFWSLDFLMSTFQPSLIPGELHSSRLFKSSLHSAIRTAPVQPIS